MTVAGLPANSPPTPPHPDVILTLAVFLVPKIFQLGRAARLKVSCFTRSSTPWAVFMNRADPTEMLVL